MGEYMKDKKLTSRIRKVKGQVEAIEKMVEKKRGCLEILQQIKAARSALAKVATVLLSKESCCYEKERKPEQFEKIVEELVKNL